MNFREYRGIRGIEIAEVTDTDSAYTVGEWKPLSGIQALAKTVNESAETHYYDNIGAIVVESEGNDEYALTLSVLDKETKALIDGTTYKNGVLVGTPRVKKYFAMRFIGTDTNGTDELNIVYKGKFTGGAETYNTKTDGAEANGVEYTFTSIYTTFKDNFGTEDAPVKKPMKLAQVELTDTLTEEAVKATTLPSAIIALGA